MSINKNTPEVCIDAFLLTRQWRDTSKGIVLDFWFYSHAGPVHVLIENQQAIFFIRQEDVEQVKRILFSLSAMLIKSLGLKDFDHRPVSAIYFTSQHDLYQARALLQDAQIRHYEADIRPVERFLAERFITGAVQIKSASRPLKANDANAQSSAQLILNPHIRPLENSKKYQPKLKTLSLDIETAYDSQALYSISLLCAHWHITLMIGAIDDGQTQALKNTQNIEFFDNEKALMLRFIELIIEQDPDVIIGWNVINFDFQFLQKKADSLKISLSIGRSESLPVWRKAQTEQEHYFLLIPGRVVLDGIDTLKNATLNFSSFSLQSVAGELLGRGKLIGDEHTDKQKSRQKNFDPWAGAKEIKRRFNEDKLALAAYNLEDCQLVWDIFAHTDLLAFAIERAKLTGLEMD
ncbi:MAG: ribonuclease H-like domain-containing protein [Thiotrichaceae bacterium]|nr:ribonuclease H-like domain-containing protein [Thiotrichaceae bacterium]